MNPQFYDYEKNQLKVLIHYVMLFMLAFSFITFVGCGSDSSTPSGPSGNNNNNGEPTDEQGANEVWMEGSSFNVSNLEVSAGTTVTWTNKSSVDHTVTSGNRSDDDAGELFDSGTIAPGGIFSHTFENAGTFDYFCDFHPGMDATVTVTE